MSGVYEAVLDYTARGWSVIPVRAGDKRPIENAWQKSSYRDAASWTMLVEPRYPGCNVGVLTGRPSGFWVLDVDPDNGGDVALKELEREHGALPSTRAHRTGSGGVHYLWAMPVDFEPTNSRGRLPEGIDVRGTGGQIVAPPSVSAKGPYTVLADAPIAPAPGWLLDLVRPQRPEPKPGDRVAVTPAAAGRLAKYAAGALAGKCDDLRGWTLTEGSRQEMAFGKAADIVRLINSPWSGIDPEQAYEAWEAAVYDHPDGVSVPWDEVAMSWRNGLRRAGHEQAPLPREREGDTQIFGGDVLTPPVPVPPVPTLGQPGAPALLAAAPVPATAGRPEPRGWTVVDISPVFAGERKRVEPTIGHRADGIGLLYPGKEHAIASEPECGKTWLAALIVADVLRKGGRVVYVDFEDDEWTIIGERLMAPGVGLEPAHLAPERFRYVRPEGAAPDVAAFTALLTFPSGAADLLVLDGVTEGMQALGIDFGKHNEAAAEWRERMVKPAMRLGTATLATDHVVKNQEARAGYAIGGQHKRAGLNGALFVMERNAPFGRGLRGSSRVYVTKDRNGGLRQHGQPDPKRPDHTYFCDLVGDAASGEMISLALFPPRVEITREDGMGAAEIETARKVFAVLRAAAPRELGTRELEEAVKGRKGTITPAKHWLAERGAILIQSRGASVKHQYAGEVESWD